MIRHAFVCSFFIAMVFGQSSLHLPLDSLEKSNDSSRGERIEMMKMWRMTEVLDLTEDQAQKFFPKYNIMIKELGELKRQQKDRIEKLRNAVKDEQNIKEKDVDMTMNMFFDLEREKLKKKQKFIEDLGDILAPKQKARYVVFEVNLKEELRRSIREHRKSRSENEGRSSKRKRERNW